MKVRLAAAISLALTLALTGCAPQNLSVKDYLKQLKAADITCDEADISRYKGKDALEAGVPEHDYIACYDEAGDQYSFATYTTEDGFFDDVVEMCSNFDDSGLEDQEFLIGKTWMLQSDSSINDLETLKDLIGGEIQSATNLCEKNSI